MKIRVRDRLGSEDTNNVLVLGGIFVLFFAVMSILSPDTFLSVATMRSMCVQVPEFGIYAFAMMLAMISGGIDLSIVSVGNLASIIACRQMIAMASQSYSDGAAVAVGMVTAVAVGCVCGVINGVSISAIGIPPMLATLATMQVFNGVSMVLTEGASVQGLPEAFSYIGSKSAFDVIPYTMLLFLAIAVVIGLGQSRTGLGLRMYLIGSNPKAAGYSGINNTLTTVIVYAMSGALAAVAGMILSSRSMSARMDYGSIYQLQAILAVVLGGISPSGGKGKTVGVLLAVLSLQVLSTGLNILNLSDTSYLKNLVWGLLLLIVLVAKYYLSVRKTK